MAKTRTERGNKTRAAILDFLSDWDKPFSPTLDEIGMAVGLSSKSSVHHHLKALESDGLVESRSGSFRTTALAEVPAPFWHRHTDVWQETTNDIKCSIAHRGLHGFADGLGVHVHPPEHVGVERADPWDVEATLNE